MKTETARENATFKINNNYKSVNYNSRLRQIILHYTVEDFESSLTTLLGNTGRQVSAHFLINNCPTQKHPDFIYQLVDEKYRSWHAGVSYWRGDTDLNSSSIGIEIVNADGNKNPYPKQQIDAVIFLVQNLMKQFKVKSSNIIGHSDIAPGRKIDPGTYFPWKRLFDNGIGAWYDEDDVNYYTRLLKKLPSSSKIKEGLIAYGYCIHLNTTDEAKEYISATNAFQRHFSSEKVDGIMSLNTYIILRSLLKKYHNLK